MGFLLHYSAAMVRVGEWLHAMDRRMHPASEGLFRSHTSPVKFASAVVRAGFHNDNPNSPLLAALLDVWRMIEEEPSKYSNGEILSQGKLVFGAMLVVMSVTIERADFHWSPLIECVYRVLHVGACALVQVRPFRTWAKPHTLGSLKRFHKAARQPAISSASSCTPATKS